MSLRLLLCFLSSAAACFLVAAAPPESKLPPASSNWESNSEKNHQTPSEAVLPTEVSDQSPAQTKPSIPAETELPDTTESAKSGTLDGLAIRPWLRLDLKAHTAMIRAVDVEIDPIDRKSSDSDQSAASATLVSAGDDKDVHVWKRNERSRGKWVHARTIRWPVVRGPRGRLYALALSAGKVAMAGHGASGGLGEIWIVDANSGRLVASLISGSMTDANVAHRQVIAAMDWSPMPASRQKYDQEANIEWSQKLASIDVEGRLLLWQRDSNTGLWSAKALVDSDSEEYGEPIARAIRSRRQFVPLSFLGNDSIVVAKYQGVVDKSDPETIPAGTAKWSLEQIDTRSGDRGLLPGSTLYEFGVAMDASPDGRTLVVSDALGNAKRLRFDRQSQLIDVARLQLGGVGVSLKIHPNGDRMICGVQRFANAPGDGDQANPNASNSELQIWDLEPMQPKLLSRRTVAKPALDVEIINDMQLDSMQELIAAQSRELVVFSIDDNGAFADDPTQRLGIAEGGIEEVAFLTDTKGYQVAIKRQQPAASPKVSDEENTTDIFDLSRVRLLNPPNPDDASLVPSRRLPSRWSVQPTATQSGLRYQFFQDQQAVGVLPLVPELHGGVTSLATMPQRLNNPPAIDQRDVDRQPETEPAPGLLIVGTGGRHGIYCFGADQSDTPRLLRQFRGHAGDVVSLGTSTDGRYLVSASSDSTIKVWNLDGIFTASTSVNRWGVDFQLISGASGPRLVAATVRADGPLHFRGVRGGDELISIRWADTSGKAYSVSAPNRIKTLLDQLPFDTLVVFNFTRLGRPQPGFQSFAAWRPLSTLLLDRDREWANWTPAGVFNASINGHRRFGWQINRGTSMLPDYYRAEQFRQTLERPDVMRRLMATGSLDAAMQTSLGAIIKPPGTEAIANQIQTQPRIKILSPRSGSTVGQSSINVVAEVSVPMGGELVPPKAFINGVPGRNRQRFVSVADQSDGNIAPQSIKQRFQWTFDLPRQTNLQLEVFASTQARSVGRATCQFRRTLDAKTRVSRRLHLLAIGVSEYRDRQIQSLDFASRATGVISDVFRTHAQPLYRVSTDILTDGDATGGMWRVFAESTVDRLMNAVSPDDLVVMYLCGHGMRDRRTNQWYFVTADARYRDLMNNQFSDCLALNDLSLFSKLPCRKLAILDSCHSGAVQDFMRPDDLKSALRYLQEDVVLTWTASEGDQEAAEKREDRLGRFTTHLVDALSGMADANDHGGNEDQVVTLKEAIAYVSRKVRDESFSEGIPQSPTAGPSDLIDAVELPLATRSN